jgi:hypothetical protein
MHPTNGRNQLGAGASEETEEFARDMVDASEVIEVLAKQMAEQMLAVFRAHAIQIRERDTTFLPPADEGKEQV